MFFFRQFIELNKTPQHQHRAPHCKGPTRRVLLCSFVPMPLALSAVADVEHHFSLYSKYLEHHVRNAVDELLDNVNILNINNI